MDYGPRKLFMMVRAGLKDKVLESNTLWNCVSCYNCVVRCPRQVPVKYVLHSLGTAAVRAGIPAATKSDNARFARAFWWSASKLGRTDERIVTALFYFSYGLSKGFKMAMANLPVALGLVKTKRMHIGAPYMCKNKGELKTILAKAAEIEARHAK